MSSYNFILFFVNYRFSLKLVTAYFLSVLWQGVYVWYFY